MESMFPTAYPSPSTTSNTRSESGIQRSSHAVDVTPVGENPAPGVCDVHGHAVAVAVPEDHLTGDCVADHVRGLVGALAPAIFRVALLPCVATMVTSTRPLSPLA